MGEKSGGGEGSGGGRAASKSGRGGVRQGGRRKEVARFGSQGGREVVAQAARVRSRREIIGEAQEGQPANAQGHLAIVSRARPLLL
jgi:hypothetical protein